MSLRDIPRCCATKSHTLLMLLTGAETGHFKVFQNIFHCRTANSIDLSCKPDASTIKRIHPVYCPMSPLHGSYNANVVRHASYLPCTSRATNPAFASTKLIASTIFLSPKNTWLAVYLGTHTFAWVKSFDMFPDGERLLEIEFQIIFLAFVLVAACMVLASLCSLHQFITSWGCTIAAARRNRQ